MWTDERVDLLKKLWAEGLSASQIAKQLGGVTRNAVIGKVHRLGLSGRATSNRAPRTRPQTAAPAALQARPQADPVQIEENVLVKEKPLTAPAPASRALPEIVAEGGATVLSLTEHTCKWPIGDPGESDFHFCGARSAPGMPYCAEHARLAYQPVQPRKRAERRRDYAV